MKNREYIHQMEPWFGEEEKNALSAYIDSGGFFTEYKVTSAFEKTLSEYTGAKHCIAVNNGTSALIAPLWSLDLKEGDEVITTPFTFVATANAIVIAGATPVFVDIDPDTLLIDPGKIEQAITEKTKAILPVHLYGRVCDMDRINEIASMISGEKITESAINQARELLK